MFGAAAGLWAADAGAKKPVSSKKEAEKTVTVDGQTYALPGVPAEPDANRYLLKKFDLNGDGRIDEAEIAAAQKKISAQPPPAAPRLEDGRRITLKDLYDGGKSAQRRKNTVGEDDIMRKIDRNGDGVIDAAEIVAFRRELDRQAGRDARTNEANYLPPFQPIKGDLPKAVPSPQKKPVR